MDMTLFYKVKIDDKAFMGSFEKPKKSTDLFNTYEVEIDDNVTISMVENRCEPLSTSKAYIEVKNSSEKVKRIGKISLGFRTKQLKGTLHYFSSSWGKEFVPHDIPIPENLEIGGLTGRSSEEYSPWIGMAGKDTFYSFTIAWSGNWKCEISNKQSELTALMGLHDEGFYSDILPGKTFISPCVYISHSKESLDDASIKTRKFFIENDSLIDKDKLDTLPATYSTWWCYEDRFISEAVCLENASYCKALGITHFVLDAGWFGIPHKEINWFGKRGDWTVENTVNFPSGIANLGKNVEQIGIPFGIWCEIEGIGDIAKLHETHPELVALRDGKPLGYLCMANPKTRKWATETISRLIEKYHATWIKLDFNVPPHLGCDCEAHGHGKGDGLYRHYLGYYQFLSEIHKKYPEVILENCGSGGMRNDLGILSHTHFAYLSDHDYIDNHFQCLWGAASFIHPAICYQFTQSECVSDHNRDFNLITDDISKEKFDLILRATLLSTCGFSYRFKNWKPEWKERLKHYIAFFKYFSKKYILLGDMFRLTGQALRDGKGDRWQAYQYLAGDDTAYIFVFRLNKAENSRTIYPKGLNPDGLYDITFEDCDYRYTRTGEAIMKDGLTFDTLIEYSSEIVKIAPGR